MKAVAVRLEHNRASVREAAQEAFVGITDKSDPQAIAIVASVL